MMKPNEADHGQLVSWRLVRFLTTANVLASNLFFAVKNAKVNKIYKRTQQLKPLTRKPVNASNNISNNHSNSREKLLASGRFSFKLIEARSQLPRIDKYIRRYYHLSYCYNIMLLIKHIIVSLMRLDLFARLRFLDCLLVGRFIVNGRTVEVAHYCCCFLTFFKLVWYSLTMRRYPTYRLPVVEFLLTKWDDITFWSSNKSSKSSFTSPNQQQEQLHSSVFEYQNLFMMECNRMFYKLRPNRTTEAWKQLAGSSVRFCMIFGIVLCFLVITFMRMMLPIIINRQGFEVNHRLCLQWVARERRSGVLSNAAGLSNSTSTVGLLFDSFKDYILTQIQPEREGSGLFNFVFRNRFDGMVIEDILMPFGDYVKFNAYHAIRTAFELVESVTIYMESALLIASMLFIANVYSNDLIIYCRHLNERLERLIVAMRLNSEMTMDANFKIKSTQTTLENIPESYRNHNQHQQIDINSRQPRVFCSINELVRRQKSAAKSLKLDIIDNQAMIADLFALLDQYNEYNSLQSIYLVVLWLSYSAMVSSWIFIPGNKSPKMEWYIIHSFDTILLFLFIIKFSEVKWWFRKLYKLIVIAMALDENYSSTKSTWEVLLKFYSPIPMYCFRIIKSVELDILFGVKMISWLSTALVVASSFFTVYNIM